jgi:hypothetical protein
MLEKQAGNRSTIDEEKKEWKKLSSFNRKLINYYKIILF